MTRGAESDRLLDSPLKTLIISDVHNRTTQIDAILSWEQPYDRVVFTGDTFDSRGYPEDTVARAVESARWLRTKLHGPKVTYLVGNHDLGALFPGNDAAWRAGDWYANDSAKLTAITGTLQPKDLARIQLYTTEAGVLLSHAGLDAELPDLVTTMGYEPPPRDYTLPALTEWLDLMWRQAKDRYPKPGQSHPILDVGQCRGGWGMQRVGGLIWRDFASHSPIDGLGQIVGHSIQDEEPLFRIINRNGAPMWRSASKGVKPEWLKEGWTLCLDTRSRHYVVIEDGVLIIKSVVWKRMGGTYEVAPGGTVTEVRLPVQDGV